MTLPHVLSHSGDGTFNLEHYNADQLKKAARFWIGVEAHKLRKAECVEALHKLFRNGSATSAALANASNVSLTLQGHWDRVPSRPGVAAGVVGCFFGVVVAVMASLASFRAIGSVTALTTFWEAIEYACLLGVGPLLVAGVSFDAIPRVTGRAMQSTNRARSFLRLTVVGVGGVLVTMGAAGIISGYSWLAGSNSAAYVDAGDGWAAGASAADPLLLIALVFGVVALLGQFAYASAVIGTVTSGRAVPQEVLVYEGNDE